MTLLEDFQRLRGKTLNRIEQTFKTLFETKHLYQRPRASPRTPRDRFACLAPIEPVSVPNFVPKGVQKFYTSALVAHQSGQTLAGLFLLRTVIEQWAQACVGGVQRHADEVLEADATQLPEDFRQRFASLSDLYGKLSGALHSASSDGVLFETTIAALDKHLDARRLYGLNEAKG